MDEGTHGRLNERRNRNRGYRDLRVWQDAIALYRLTVNEYRHFDGQLRKIGSQAISAADSVHRNIAEGYCRRSLKEYLNFINIALGSLGESVSAAHAYVAAGQLSREAFDRLDEALFRLENGLLKLRDSLQNRDASEWQEKRVVREEPALYES